MHACRYVNRSRGARRNGEVKLKIESHAGSSICNAHGKFQVSSLSSYCVRGGKSVRQSAKVGTSMRSRAQKAAKSKGGFVKLLESSQNFISTRHCCRREGLDLFSMKNSGVIERESVQKKSVRQFRSPCSEKRSERAENRITRRQ